jgi:hypothetical protein
MKEMICRCFGENDYTPSQRSQNRYWQLTFIQKAYTITRAGTHAPTWHYAGFPVYFSPFIPDTREIIL